MKKIPILYLCIAIQAANIQAMEPKSADYERMRAHFGVLTERMERHEARTLSRAQRQAKVAQLEAQIRNLESSIERQSKKASAQLRALARDSRVDNSAQIENLRQQSQSWLEKQNNELVDLKRKLAILQDM